MRADLLRVVFTGACLAAVLPAGPLCRCTPAQTAKADALAIDLTNAVCKQLEGQDAANPYVTIACTLAATGEQVVQLTLPSAQATALCLPRDAGGQ